MSGGITVETLAEQMRVDRANFQERIIELELELEDVNWHRLSGSGADAKEFTREGLRTICKESFLFYMKNPLIKRATDTQSNYVFGQGVTIKAAHPLVDEVVQSFLIDKKNKQRLTSVPAMVKAETDLRIDANLFVAFFKNGEGDVRVSLIPFDEIWDVESNPEDRAESWLYLRQWTQTRDSSGRFQTMRKEYYPDIDYNPSDKPAEFTGKYGKCKVNWDTPIYHVKTNVVLNQKFGTSELYAAQDWARAYNKFLSDWATIVRSYARFAWDMVKKTGSAGRLAAKTKLDSNISNDQYQPAPATASVFIHDEGTKMAPIHTSGATTSADDGRRLLLMVCAATGLPETFFGDASVGTLATARSLNRPTELAFSLRQRLWEIVFETILAYVIQCKAEVGYESDNPYIKGDLTGVWEDDAWKEPAFIYADDAENEDPDLAAEPIDVSINIDFPPLVEDDQKAQIDAIVSAATLDGNPLAGTLDAKYTTERLLRVLGETSIEEIIEKLFPEGEEPEAKAVGAALQDLQQAIEAIAEAKSMPINDVVKLLAETYVIAFKEASKGIDEGESVMQPD